MKMMKRGEAKKEKTIAVKKIQNVPTTKISKNNEIKSNKNRKIIDVLKSLNWSNNCKIN